MVLIETLFHNGRPLGKIRQDLHRGIITFTPKEGHTLLARRKWKSVTACQRAVITTYKNENPPG